MLNVDPRERFEMEERWEAADQRHRVLSAGLVLLLLALVGGGWYAFDALHRHESALTQFPGVQEVVEGIGNQVKQTDQKIASWANDQQSLHDQMSKLGQRLEARVATIAKQAQSSSAEMYRRVQAQIDERLQSVNTRFARVDARLTQVESANESEQTTISALQRELADVRSQTAKQADDLANLRSKMEESNETHNRQLTGLRESGEQSRRDVDAIEHSLAVHRVDFEVTKSRSREVAEGISLNVTSTDLLHRTVSGWMWIAPDRRTIWLKGQTAGEPLIYYGHADGKKRELVITNVTKRSTTGYLLLPGESSTSRVIASATSDDQGRIPVSR